MTTVFRVAGPIDYVVLYTAEDPVQIQLETENVLSHAAFAYQAINRSGQISFRP